VLPGHEAERRLQGGGVSTLASATANAADAAVTSGGRPRKLLETRAPLIEEGDPVGDAGDDVKVVFDDASSRIDLLCHVLKPVQGIVANLEFAVGKDGNRGLLFEMGYAW